MIERQVRKLLEEGMEEASVAAELGVPEEVVRYIRIKEIDESAEDFSKEDRLALAKIIKSVAFNGENERNRLQAAIYGHEVAAGLRVPKSQLPQINVAQFNQIIHSANERIGQFISKGQPVRDPAANGSASAGEVTVEIPGLRVEGPGHNNHPPAPSVVGDRTSQEAK